VLELVIEASAFFIAGCKLTVVLRMKLYHPIHEH
jgi:hypothetical protein